MFLFWDSGWVQIRVRDPDSGFATLGRDFNPQVITIKHKKQHNKEKKLPVTFYILYLLSQKLLTIEIAYNTVQQELGLIQVSLRSDCGIVQVFVESESSFLSSLCGSSAVVLAISPKT